MKVFPNPIQEQAEIQFDNLNNEERWISLYTHTGQHIWTQQTRQSQLRFSRYGLVPGIYHLRIRNEKQFLSSKSLQIQ
ncbi:MAG: T9SS type A sorting domain-containing protein [Bacteroidota bacterium]